MKSKLHYLKFDKINPKKAQNSLLFLVFFMFTIGSAFAQYGIGGADNNNGDVRLIYVGGAQNSVTALSTVGTTNEISVQSIKASPQQLHSLSVKMQLPPGVEYEVGSVAITNNNGTGSPIGTYVIGELDITDLNAPVFSIYNGGVDVALWGAGDYVNFSFERTADCDAVAYKEEFNEAFKDVAEITYVKTGFPGTQTAVDVNSTIGNYDLLAASLSVESILAEEGIVGGNVHTRTISDLNGGNSGVSEVIHTVEIGSSVSNYSFSYFRASDGVTNTILPTTSTIDASTGVTTNTYLVNLVSDANYSGGGTSENGNGVLDPGETLVFTEQFTLIDCEETDIEHQVEWTCQSSQKTAGVILFGANSPELDINVLENHRNISGINHVRIEVTNTSTAPAGFAKDILINLALGSNGQSATTSYTNNPHWGTAYRGVRGFSNFTLGDGVTQTPYSPEAWPSDRSGPSGVATTDAMLPDIHQTDIDGPGGLQDYDGDTYVDDLAPGGSFVIEFDYQAFPRDNNCGTGRFDYMNWEHVFFDALTKDQCDSPRPAKGVDLGYNNFIRDYNNATVFEQDTDIEELVPFEVALRPYLYSNFTHNDHAMLNSNGDSEFTVSIEVPRGVDLVAGAPPEFTQVNGAYTVGVAGAGTNIISFSTTNILSGFVVRDFADFFTRFPLVMNCAELELGGVQSVINISYETNLKLYDTAGGAVVFERDIHCGNFEPIIEHSCNPPCAGPNITGLDAYRITAGWTDNNMTAKVDLTETNPDGSPKYELDKYLAGDEMVVETSGFMSNLSSDNLHFIQDYTTDGTTAGIDDIEFISGTIVINKFGGGTTLELPVNDPVKSSSGNNHSLDFDLSSALSDAIVGGLIEDQDTFEVKFKYQFTTNTYTNFGYHILSGFRGRYYIDETLPAGANAGAIDNDNDNDGIPNERISCFDWGDQVAYLRPDNLAYTTANSTFKYCETPWVNIINDYTRSNSPHLHTGEYRPTTMIQSTELIIPDGVKVLDVRQYNNQGYYYVSSGELDISPALGTPGVNTYTVTPNRAAGYRDQDQTSSVSYRMQVLVKGSCELKDASEGAPIPTITSTSIVQHMAYTETPLADQLLTRTPSSTLSYTKPTFILQPLVSTIVVGSSPEANFDLRVVNNSASGGDVGFNWIKVPSTPNITIVGADDITGAPIALNVVNVGGDSYIEIGSLAAGDTKDIRVRATYDSCTDIPVDFSLGWDCDSYPTNYGDVTSSCYDDTTELTLQPSEAQIQQIISSQPTGPVNMCDAFDVQLEYNSAQVGTIVNPISTLKLFNGTGAVVINSILVEYPAGSGNTEDILSLVTNLDADTYSVPIVHSGMTPVYGGIPGTGAVGASVNDRKVIVTYNLSATCDFVSNSPVSFSVFGDRTCGEPSIGNGSKSVSNGIKVNGLEPTYDALSVISLPDFANPDGGHIDGCTAQEKIIVNTTISELPTVPGATTGDFDFGRVELPFGVTYVDGTFNSTGVNAVTLSSSTPNQLIIKYPSGLADQDTTEFEFDIIPEAGYCEDDAAVSYITYVEDSAGVSCGGTSCGGNLIATGTTSEDLDIKKAAVDINLDSAVSSVSFSDEVITAGFTIDNTSDIEVTAPSTIGAYFDTNKDGIFDAGDLLLGSHQITSAIPGGTSITESIEFTATPAQACNILLVMTVDDNPCICLPASVSMGAPSTLIGVGGEDTPVCEAFEGSSVTLGSPNNSGYTYSWTGVTANDDISYLDDATTAQPNFVYSGPSLTATTTFTYQVEVTRIPEGCTSTDTVDVTVVYTEEPSIGSSELDVCDDEYLSITFDNVLSGDQVIEIWKNAALTTSANAPNTSGNWTSTELFSAGTGNLYATVRNTVTGCRSAAVTIPYTVTDCATDLVTVKSVSPTTASIGDNVVFTITVSNIGASVDKNVTLSDVLPSDVTFVSDNSSGAYNPVSGLWTIGDIASSGSASIEITATINSQAAGGTVTNTTSAASGDYTDDSLTNGDDLTASVTVNNLVIAAANDNYPAVNGFDGDTNLGNILTGTGDDSLNGNPVTTADVAITYPNPATVDGNPITGTSPEINASGDVSVPAGTPAGTYSIPYTICEIGNSNNCSDAIVTVIVNAPAIVAVNDDYTSNPVLSADGNTNLGNILVGTGDDTLNGDPTDINEVDINLTSGMFFDNGSGPVAATGTIPDVDPLTGDVSVPVGTPAGTYTINYNICEELNPTNCSTDAVVTILVVEPPVANADSNSGNTTTQPSAPINILSNDLLGDGITTATVLNTTVDLDPNTAGDQDVLVVPGEGTWNYNTSNGELIFTPETTSGGFGSNFTDDPTPIDYVLTETQTGLTDTATVTVDYVIEAPVAENDSSLGNVAGAVTIDPLVSNGGGVDADSDGTIDPTTVSLVAPTNATSIVTDANGDVTSFAVPNEGSWSVDETTGAITFTPLATFTNDPTVISYNVEDNDGNVSNDATVTIDYVPVAEDNTSNGNTVGDPAVLDIVSDDINGDEVVSSTIDLDPSTPGTQETTLVVPGEGTWAVDAAGELTFTPEVGFTTDPTAITYTIEDAEGNVSDPATITVTYDELPPVAEDDSVSGVATGDPAVLTDITSNDTLSDGSPIDTTPGTGNAVISLDPTDSDGDGDPLTLVVPGEGTWTYDPTTDDLTFTPETTSGGFGSNFTDDPTPIDYVLTETQTGLTDTATVTVDYVIEAPVAEDDSSLGNVAGAVTIDPLVSNGGGVDADSDGTIDPTTVSLVAPTNATSIVTDANGDVTSFAVPNEGSWSVDETTGAITFTPLATFTNDPTVISYNVEDNDGNVSNDATVTIDYVPVAEDNTSNGNTVGDPAVLDIVSDDINGDEVVSSTIDLDPSTPGTQETTLVVPGEGTWAVDAAGELTFTPEVGFTTDPTAITYTIEDAEGNVSDPATITVTYDELPPVAEDDSVAGVATGDPAVLTDITSNDTLSDGSPIDTTPGTGNAVISLDPTDSDGDGDPLTLVVPGEGTWTYDPTTDDLTFTPETTSGGFGSNFTDDPTPIDYVLTETQTGLTDTATVTVDYVIEAPVAEDDSSLGNVAGAVTIDPLVSNGGGVDADSDGTIDPTTVSLVAPTNATSIVTDANGDVTSFAVPNEGSWSVDETTGAITFTPLATFTNDPTVISYNVEDNDGNVSNDATVTIDYVPVAEDNTSNGNTVGDPAVLDIVSDDINGDEVVSSTIDLDPSTPGTQETTLVVPGEGTWAVDATGELTFTPEVGFTTDPTAITYTIEDAEGNVSDPATITVTYDELPPVAEDDSVSGIATGDPAVLTDITSNDTLSDGSPIDTTPGTGNAVISLDPTDSDGDGDPLTLVVPGEGTWTYDPTTDDLTFTPETTSGGFGSNFTDDPTPIDYVLTETQTGLTDTATVTVDYVIEAPVAENDSSLGNVAGAVTIDPLVSNGGGVDADSDGTIDPTTVSLVAPTNATSIVTDANGDVTSFAVPNEGSWSVDETTGAITFTPLATFTNDPTVISYNVEDNDGNVSNDATVTIDYVPVAEDNTSNGNTVGDPAVLDIVSDDINGDEVVSSTIDLDPSTPGTQETTLVVPGEGTWAVDAAGELTFTPEVGFTTDPTAITYTIEDAEGNVSDPATITVTYDELPPVAEDDSVSGVATGDPAVLTDITSNDTLSDGSPIDTTPGTGNAVISLDPTDSDGDGDPLTLVVPGEGTWTYDPTTDDLTFTPETTSGGFGSNFTDDPTPIDYVLTETQTGLTDTATVTVDYVIEAPVAEDDSSLGNVAGAVTIDPLVSNGGGVDADSDGTIDPTTVSLVAPTNATSIVTDANGDVTSFAVPNEGSWSVDETTGAITFTPLATFTNDPTVISYNVEDNDGNVSNDATVTIDYVPVAEDNTSNGNTVGDPAVLDIVSDDINGDEVVSSTIDLDPSTPGTQETTLVVPGEGTWAVDATGELTFTPEVGFTTDPTAITYTIEDAEGNVSDPATITVTYDELPPVAEDDSVSGIATGDPAVLTDITSNDTLSDGSPIDTTPGTGNAVISLDPTDSDGDGDPLTLVVPGEGTWTYDPTTDDLTFTPETTSGGFGSNFTDDPTPIDYVLTETQTGLTDTATVTVDYVIEAPVAENDSSLGNVAGAVTIDPLVSNGGGVDADSDGTIDPTTVSLVAPTNATSIVTDANGDVTSFAVPNEGSWSVDETTGAITFTPLATFTNDPTVISYNVEDNDGNVSNDATVTIDYVPVAEDNTSNGNTVGDPAVLDIVSDDINGDEVVSSTIDLDPSTPGTQETTLVVPGEGTWAVDAAGELTFTPEVGFTTDPTAITYTIEDAEGNVSDPATITVTYDELPPVAEDDSVSGVATGDPAVLTDITSNDTLSDGSPIDTTPGTGNAVISLDPTDSDGDGDPLTLVVPGEGTWTYDPTTDDLTFTPETTSGGFGSNFTDDPTPIDYVLTETQTGLTDTATVTVDYVIEAPVAEDDSSLGNVAGAVTIDPLVSNGGGVDADSDGTIDPTTVSLVAPTNATSIVTDANGDVTSFAVPNEGSWSVDETTGAITFTPLATFTNDPTVISYNVEDNDGNVSNDATVTIDYVPVAEDNTSNGNTVGDPAVLDIVSDDINGDEVVSSTIDLDPSTPGTQETTLVVPGEGTWAVDAAGELTFTPEVGFTTDPTAITYTIEDAEGNVSDPATITVTYDELPPVAEDDSVAGVATGDPAVLTDITSNDTLSDGSPIDTTPGTGNAVISLDPTDSDGDGDPLTLVVPGEGTWTYDPTTDDLTFTPETTSGGFGSNFTDDPTPIDYVLTETQTGLTDTATVTVDYVIEAPVAEDDSSLGNVAGAVTIDPLVSNGGGVDADSDGTIDPTTVSLVAPTNATSIVTDANGDVTSFAVPNEGSWSVDETTGAITFTPLATFTNDPTVISYNVEDNDGNVSNDATVTITYVIVTTDAINDVNNTFVDVAVNGNVITNDEDAEGDTQTVSSYDPLSTSGGTVTMSPNGDYIYTPPTGFIGTDTFTYTVCDDGTPQACDTATVTIDVFEDPNADVNEVVANNDTATTESGSPVDVVVLANDLDPEGDTFTVTPGSVSTPTNGTVVENADGTITYTPNAGFEGEDVFTYEVCDSGSPQACDTATVTVTVDPADADNDTYANDDAYNGNPNADITGNLLDNDTDPEGNTQTITSTPVDDVDNGTLVLNPDGTFTYTPDPGFTGTDSFVYEVCDDGTPTVCDQATVYITVNPIVNPMIELLKTASVDAGIDNHINEGDIITYTFTVENTGDVTVSNITVTDVMLGVTDLPVISGTLDPTETGVVTFDYTITAADIAAGRIENTATANGVDPYGDPVTDISDDPNDADTTDTEGDGEADGPTITALPSQLLELTKDGAYIDGDSDGVVEVGEIITYTFIVENIGNIDVTGITIDDARIGVAGLAIDPIDLAPGETGTVTFDYSITQTDIDADAVYNTATANGTTSEGPVFDDSEDPTPLDPSHTLYDATCPDCTVTPLTSPQIELLKTADLDIGDDGVVKAGEIITYTFTVVNTGNVTVEGITVTDNMLGVTDAPIVSPLLIPGQVGVYTFEYEITEADIAAGSIENTATANGVDPSGNPVSDISDDPNDTDTTDVEGDGEADGPTVTFIPSPMADIVTVKDDGFDKYLPGTDVVYTITVTNNGPSDAVNVIVSDPMPSGIVDVTWVGDNGASGTGDLDDTIAILVNGDTVTYTVTLSVPFEFTGDLTNTVTVISDTIDPDPTCTSCSDTNTLEPVADIAITKEASVESALVNDEITFTISAENKGPQEATNILIEEMLPSGYEYISHITTSGVYNEDSGLWTIDALAFNDVELLEVTVKVLNATDYTNVASVLSLDQVDLDDSNNEDEVTLGVVLSTTCIEVFTSFTPHNVDGINDFFTIDCIENYPKNTLEIYNRWGYLVYSADGYNNTWDGISNGPRTINDEDKVPAGTYYYVLDLGQGDEPRVGWIYIN